MEPRSMHFIHDQLSGAKQQRLSEKMVWSDRRSTIIRTASVFQVSEFVRLERRRAPAGGKIQGKSLTTEESEITVGSHCLGNLKLKILKALLKTETAQWTEELSCSL